MQYARTQFNMGSMTFVPSLGAVVLVTTTTLLDRNLQTWVWTGTDWVRIATHYEALARLVSR